MNLKTRTGSLLELTGVLSDKQASSLEKNIAKNRKLWEKRKKKKK